MAKYKIAIEERLVREVEVEAASVEEALHDVEEQWCRGKVILDADDFRGVQIACIEPEPTEWKEI